MIVLVIAWATSLQDSGLTHNTSAIGLILFRGLKRHFGYQLPKLSHVFFWKVMPRESNSANSRQAPCGFANIDFGVFGDCLPGVRWLRNTSRLPHGSIIKYFILELVT